eukprot:TRINITY_DN10702_c0_g1_i1.p1 TRINITY_DN10702_c0_g1~~TRINITY_DN10702_c0_g1_i1.p1  ORF type:complete len:287 (+),score=33.12 TRINITY_DN10702_c0_g1_i1:48-863(+)
MFVAPVFDVASQRADWHRSFYSDECEPDGSSVLGIALQMTSPFAASIPRSGRSEQAASCDTLNSLRSSGSLPTGRMVGAPPSARIATRSLSPVGHLDYAGEQCAGLRGAAAASPAFIDASSPQQTSRWIEAAAPWTPGLGEQRTAWFPELPSCSVPLYDASEWTHPYAGGAGKREAPLVGSRYGVDAHLATGYVSPTSNESPIYAPPTFRDIRPMPPSSSIARHRDCTSSMAGNRSCDVYTDCLDPPVDRHSSLDFAHRHYYPAKSFKRSL